MTMDRAEFLFVKEFAKLEGVCISTVRRKQRRFNEPFEREKPYRYTLHPNGQYMYFKGDLNRVYLLDPKPVKPGRGRPRKIFSGRCAGNGHAAGDADLREALAGKRAQNGVLDIAT